MPALDKRVDVVVVMPHWGTQYTHAPEPVQRTVARGSSTPAPTWWSAATRTGSRGSTSGDGVVVAHSLGNFVFDMDFMTETQQGVMLEATYWGDQLKAIELVPYRMDAVVRPRLAGPAEAAEILDDVWSASTGPVQESR